MSTKFNYGSMVKTADRLIKKFGGPLTIVVTSLTPPTGGSWKPGTPTSSELTIDGVFTQYEQKFVDGSVIQQGDQKVIFSAANLNLLPNLSGYIKRNGEKWNIKSIKPLNPGGTIIIYIAQVRQ